MRQRKARGVRGGDPGSLGTTRSVDRLTTDETETTFQVGNEWFA